MNDPIYSSFIRRQQEDGLALAGSTDLLDLHVLPAPLGNRFLASFYCKGLALDQHGAVVQGERWDIEVRFPTDYLRRRVHTSELFGYRGPFLMPFQPNIRVPFICLQTEAGSPLVELLYGLYELLSWNLYATHDPLNETAAQWARQQPEGTFPIDRRPLKWRRGDAPGAETATHKPSRV